jgi:uncharacterized membrane protein
MNLLAKRKRLTMAHNRIYALYRNFEDAATIANQLIAGGYDSQNVSVITHDPDQKYAKYVKVDGDNLNTENVSGEEGAGLGALIGAFTGLTMALIPGFGPILAAGPLAAALVGGGIGAATGAATGGLVASLVDFGVSPENAKRYQDILRTGGAMVIVDLNDMNEEQTVRNILKQQNPIDVEYDAMPN